MHFRILQKNSSTEKSIDFKLHSYKNEKIIKQISILCIFLCFEIEEIQV